MINNELPLVSVCIPTYNGELYIKEAFQSVISQTYTNLEIIVSDDASSDSTLDIIASYKNKTTIPIHIYSHKPNGIGANWNYCVKQAKGEYIKFLFQDDVLHPKCIESMISIAIKDDRLGLVFCKRNFIYESLTEKVQSFIDYYGNLHNYWDGFVFLNNSVSGKKLLRNRSLLNSPKNKIGEPTAVLFKSDCINTIGLFNEALHQSLDHEYWYRVMTKYHIAFLDESLVYFRLHDNQASAINKRKPKEDMALYLSYYKSIFKYLHIDNKMKLLKLYHPLFKGLVKLKQKFFTNE